MPSNAYSIYGITVASYILTIFWLAASSSMASVLRNCLTIKKLETNFDYEFNSEFNYNFYLQKYTCNGEIITVSFGFSLFVLWVLVSYILSNNIYNRLFKSPSEDVHIIK